MVTAERVAETMSELYQRLHRRPELGLHLPETVAAISEALSGLPLELHRGRTLDSLVAVLRGPEGGPVTVLRADTDALPISEAADHDPRSEVEGAMHACGHDAHAAMLVGAAHLLAAEADRLPGPVVFAWQPGEEGHDGMGAMLSEGLMELVTSLGARARTFGLHVLSDPGVPTGVFTGRPGASHASTGTFDVVFRGRGGHAAFPHLALDPLPALADFVTVLSGAAARSHDPFEPEVLTTGTITAGTAPNVIAGEAAASGTFRAYSAESAARLGALVRRVAEGAAQAHGVDASVELHDGYPPVVNDPECVTRFAAVVERTLGPGRFRPMAHPLPAGDDYGRLLERIPGAFFMLGGGIPDADGVLPPNHSPDVRLDQSVFIDGAAVLAAVVLEPEEESE
ncbi:M20 family metallopeptidase [Leucobacter allii]|uniref:M20 metallopeptidase family protein n=1 Tax=Leucobacter allii TaxID=2932247 RepID=UPI001FD5E3AC|nr:M20 family metallopeptidase [Leucobacter allii]UOR01531.1 M20 family metallopeptidase [Leucobacter allii]